MMTDICNALMTVMLCFYGWRSSTPANHSNECFRGKFEGMLFVFLVPVLCSTASLVMSCAK